MEIVSKSYQCVIVSYKVHNGRLGFFPRWVRIERARKRWRVVAGVARKN